MVILYLVSKCFKGIHILQKKLKCRKKGNKSSQKKKQTKKRINQDLEMMSRRLKICFVVVLMLLTSFSKSILYQDLGYTGEAGISLKSYDINLPRNHCVSVLVHVS